MLKQFALAVIASAAIALPAIAAPATPAPSADAAAKTANPDCFLSATLRPARSKARDCATPSPSRRF